MAADRTRDGGSADAGEPPSPRARTAILPPADGELELAFEGQPRSSTDQRASLGLLGRAPLGGTTSSMDSEIDEHYLEAPWTT